MINRLRYDTEAGNLSSAGTYSQLTEHLRLAQEAALVLGHYYKANDDRTRGEGFLRVGELLGKTCDGVVRLATMGVRQ